MDKENQKNILLIEDDIPLLEAVQIKLEKNNFTVLTSRSVENAFGKDITEFDSGKITIDSIEKALKFLSSLERVDAIWLDHNLLGKENGLDFVLKLYSNGHKWRHVPIFVVSNTASEDLKRAYDDLGVTKYYVKAEHRLDDIVKDIKEVLKV